MCIRLLICLVVVSGMASVGGAAPKVIEDVEYASPGGHSLMLDVYLPEKSGSGLRPAVVFVHGGGWKNGSKKSARKTPQRTRRRWRRVRIMFQSLARSDANVRNHRASSGWDGSGACRCGRESKDFLP